LIIDEELKLKRLKAIEKNGHRTSIKNKNRDNKILEIQKYFAAGRLVNIQNVCLSVCVCVCVCVCMCTVFTLSIFYPERDLFYILVLLYSLIYTLILLLYTICTYIYFSLLLNRLTLHILRDLIYLEKKYKNNQFVSKIYLRAI